MPPKFDPNEVKYIYVRQYGGEPGAPSVLAKSLGPLGLSPKKVGDDLSKNTQAWKGIKVTVRIAVQNRQTTFDVIPTATALIIKELKEAPRDRKKVKNIKHNGDLPLDTILRIARTIRESKRGIPAKEFKGTVKEILGTCNAVGCTVDGRKPTELQEAIDDGEIEVPME